MVVVDRKKLCDEDCNHCPIIIHPNSRMVTRVLNLAIDRFGNEFYRIVEDNCPNLTVCFDCRIDDFCHIEGCDLIDLPKEEKLKRKLYKFYWDCGRMGSLDGLFVATDEEIKMVLNKEIYFGEVLGKHSEVYGTIEEKDLTVASEDQDFINKLVEIIGSTTISGYNPVSYYETSLECGHYDSDLEDICFECSKYVHDGTGNPEVDGQLPFDCKQWLRKDDYSDCPKVSEILKFMARPEEDSNGDEQEEKEGVSPGEKPNG